MNNEELDSLSNELIEAVEATRHIATKAGPVYGKVVEIIVKCMKAGMTRKQIAKIAAKANGSDKESKGLIARYVILARYEIDQDLGGSVGPHGSSKGPGGILGDNGQFYKYPLTMLYDGQHTFTRTYKLWTQAAKGAEGAKAPAKQNTDETLLSAAERLLAGLVLKTKKTGSLVVLESTSAYCALLMAMLAQPTAKTILGQWIVQASLKAIESWVGLEPESESKCSPEPNP